MDDIIIVGGGLAGLSAAFRLARAGRHPRLLEARTILGGRTSSWTDDGMPVESGLHRFLGFFCALPELLRDAGLDLDRAITWEDSLEVRHPDGTRAVFAASPLHHPLDTLTSMLGNNELVGPAEKGRLAAMATAGMADWSSDPRELDSISVRDYALQHGVSEQAIARVLNPLCAGLFFLPADRYSAFNFFGLIGPFLSRIHLLRVGAWRGGMTEVLADPLAAAIEAAGGTVERDMPVEELVGDASGIRGVRVRGTVLRAHHVVLAASLAPAKQLLLDAFGENGPFGPVLRAETMSAVTFQAEFSRPTTDVDRTTFTGTSIACCAEQARTTFRRSTGRLSMILSPPEAFLGVSPERVAQRVVAEAERVGFDVSAVKRYRVITERDQFLSVAPGNAFCRPDQRTSVPGLTLAGDWTRQPYLSTMEGAVVSGQLAADVVLGK